MYLNLNETQYQLAINAIKNKYKTDPLPPVELLVLDLCRRVEWLESENRRIRKFCKK